MAQQLRKGEFSDHTQQIAADAGLLILRLAVAAVFIAHGWGDVTQEGGVGTNVENYRDAGIPIPELSAPFGGYMQLVGGIVFIFGALTRLISVGFIAVMAGALIFVHRGDSLVIAPDGSGSGFALIMCAASVALLLLGAGRFSVDRLVAGWRLRSARSIGVGQRGGV